MTGKSFRSCFKLDIKISFQSRFGFKLDMKIKLKTLSIQGYMCQFVAELC